MAKKVKVVNKTPLELIKEGIEGADWNKVSKGYENLTGNKVKTPQAGKAPVEVKVEAKYNSEDVVKQISDTRAEVLLRISRVVNDVFYDAIVYANEVKKNLESLDPVEHEEAEEADISPIAPSLPEMDQQKVNDFHIDHSQNQPVTTGEYKRYCRSEPFEPGMKNNFKDDGLLEKKLTKADKNLWKNKEPIERRPAKKTKVITVQCWKCKKEQEMNEADAHPIIEGERCRYTCPKCLRRPR